MLHLESLRFYDEDGGGVFKKTWHPHSSQSVAVIYSKPHCAYESVQYIPDFIHSNLNPIFSLLHVFLKDISFIIEL